MNTRTRLGMSLLACCALGALYHSMPVRIGVVVGNSMSPSLRHGSVYLMSQMDRPDEIHSGDVVVFRQEGVNYIKRVIAVGGDEVYVFTTPSSGRDELIMDWQLSRLSRAFSQPGRYNVKVVARKVPPGYCYVVGDYMTGSIDSRDLGPIPMDQVIGKMIDAPEQVPELDHVAVINAAGAHRAKS